MIEAIGNKIRMRRKALHMTQQELADAIGVNIQTVRSYEADKYFPKTENLYKLECALAYEDGEPFSLHSARTDFYGLADVDLEWETLEYKMPKGYSLQRRIRSEIIRVNFPDGKTSVDIQADRLRAIVDEAMAYLTFRLEVLRNENEAREHGDD